MLVGGATPAPRCSAWPSACASGAARCTWSSARPTEAPVRRARGPPGRASRWRSPPRTARSASAGRRHRPPARGCSTAPAPTWSTPAGRWAAARRRAGRRDARGLEPVRGGRPRWPAAPGSAWPACCRSSERTASPGWCAPAPRARCSAATGCAGTPSAPFPPTPGALRPAGGAPMSDVDLSTELAGLTLPTPVMTAAGCAAPAGSSRRSSTWPRSAPSSPGRSPSTRAPAGRPPRMRGDPSGAAQRDRPAGPGLHALPRHRAALAGPTQGAAPSSRSPGSTLGEYAELARRLGNAPGRLRPSRSTSPPRTRRPRPVLRARPVPGGQGRRRRPSRHAARLPVLAKLDADVTDIVDVAEAVVKAGADAVVARSTRIAGLALDPATLRPALGRGRRPQRPRDPTGRAALRVARCTRRCRTSRSSASAASAPASTRWRCWLAGASAVQVGTAVLTTPARPRRSPPSCAASSPAEASAARRRRRPGPPRRRRAQMTFGTRLRAAHGRPRAALRGHRPAPARCSRPGASPTTSTGWSGSR